MLHIVGALCAFTTYTPCLLAVPFSEQPLRDLSKQKDPVYRCLPLGAFGANQVCKSTCLLRDCSEDYWLYDETCGNIHTFSMLRL
jgi:hypothetical protein